MGEERSGLGVSVLMTPCCVQCTRKALPEIIISNYWDMPAIEVIHFCSMKCFKRWVIKKGRKWSK